MARTNTPFVSSEAETPSRTSLSTSLEANGGQE
jgi:hypothetical protein